MREKYRQLNMDALLVRRHELDDDYNALFQSRSGNKEVIFEVMFDGINKGHACDNLFMPPSIDNGWGSQTNPTQELVDSYEMLDGTPFDWNKVIRTGYLMPDDGLGLVERTYTGYYIRKFLDETLPFEKLYFGGSQTSWKELRLAEVLLNYAEAQNEAKP